jgi:hypothetical protein
MLTYSNIDTSTHGLDSSRNSKYEYKFISILCIEICMNIYVYIYINVWIYIHVGNNRSMDATRHGKELNYTDVIDDALGAGELDSQFHGH